MNIDPDLRYVLERFGSFQTNVLERVRVNKVRKKREEQSIERLTTHVELLTDELEQVVPRDSPLFLPLLAMVMVRKFERQAEARQEPEFRSFLEFPNDL